MNIKQILIVPSEPWISKTEYEKSMNESWVDKIVGDRTYSFGYYETIARWIINQVYQTRIMQCGGLKADTIIPSIALKEEDQKTIKFYEAWYVRELRWETRKPYELLQDFSSSQGSISNTWGTLVYESLKDYLPKPVLAGINSVQLSYLVLDPNFHDFKYKGTDLTFVLKNELKG